MKLYLRNKVWWVTHQAEGKQIRISTGCTDRAEAQAKAMRLLVPVLTQSDDEARVATATAIMGMLRRDRRLDEAKAVPLASLWGLHPYEGSGKRAIKDSVRREARRAWDCFLRYCSGNGLVHVSDVTPARADAFLASRGRERYATVCFYVCRRMFEQEGVQPNPFGKKPAPPDSGTTHREPLTRPQIAALLAEADRLAALPDNLRSADAPEFAAFVRFLLYTGLRLGDAATFPSDGFDAASGILSRVMAKTGRRVSFPAHPSMLPLLSPGDGYLFPSMAKTYLSGQHALTRRFARLFDRLGISGEPGQYCAHCLRTTFASVCAENGVPIAVIQSWLGHQSQEVTRIYARVEDMRAKRRAMALFPDLG